MNEHDQETLRLKLSKLGFNDREIRIFLDALRQPGSLKMNDWETWGDNLLKEIVNNDLKIIAWEEK